MKIEKMFKNIIAVTETSLPPEVLLLPPQVKTISIGNIDFSAENIDGSFLINCKMTLQGYLFPFQCYFLFQR